MRGGDVYAIQCSSCHGPSGEGHVGPSFIGNPISLAEAQAVIRNGSGTMPGGLVSEAEEPDVLAFLATMLALQSDG